MSEPVNSVTMKVLQPLWNESSPRTNISTIPIPELAQKNAPLFQSLWKQMEYVLLVNIMD